MIGIIFLGIWMLLIVYDLWKIKYDIWDTKKRLDRLEWLIEKKSESER
jgi:hypothetical protein